MKALFIILPIITLKFVEQCPQSDVWELYFFNTVNPHFYDPNSSISYANLKKTKHISHVNMFCP